MTTIEINMRDNVSAAVRALAAGIDPAAVNQVAGQAAVKVYQQHLIGLSSSRSNALGGTPTRYYGKAASATHYDVVPDGVLISISQVGMALHYYGGTVKAGKGISRLTGKPTKYLTIPARAEAHGKTAGDFNDLVILWGKDGPYALARAAQTAISISRPDKLTGLRTVGSKGERGGEVLFWLRKEITVQPDPTILPESSLVLRETGRAILSYSERLWQQGAGAPRGRTLDMGGPN